MNEIINNRLLECGITKSEILKHVKEVNCGSAVLIYTSHLEGLGTFKSDFDIYVICDQLPSDLIKKTTNDAPIDMLNINSTVLDIEYWTYDNVKNIIDQVNTRNGVDIGKLKLLQKMLISETLEGHDEALDIKKCIRESKLVDKVIRFHMDDSKATLDDAVTLLENEHQIPALNCARYSLEKSIAALNAANGSPNLKYKWISRIFIEQSTEDVDLVERYKKLQIFNQVTESNINQHTKDLILLTQDVLSRLTFKL